MLLRHLLYRNLFLYHGLLYLGLSLFLLILLTLHLQRHLYAVLCIKRQLLRRVVPHKMSQCLSYNNPFRPLGHQQVMYSLPQHLVQLNRLFHLCSSQHKLGLIWIQNQPKVHYQVLQGNLYLHSHRHYLKQLQQRCLLVQLPVRLYRLLHCIHLKDSY